MDAFLQEYAFVLISIVALGFLLAFFVILPVRYKAFERQLMSGLTGVPVENLVEAEKVVEYIQAE